MTRLTEASLDCAQRRRQCTAPAALDPALLLSTGALAGPYRRAHPFTLTLGGRVVRALRGLLFTHWRSL